MTNTTLDTLKAEMLAKFAQDGIENTKTVAAIARIDNDFENGNVAITYVPLLQISVQKEGLFFQPAQLNAPVKSGVFDKELVQQWRTLRTELFGEVPKGILKAQETRTVRSEDTAYLTNANRIGREINKAKKEVA